MPNSIIDSQGQVIIPKEIWDALDLHVGCRLEFVIENGRVYIQPVGIETETFSEYLDEQKDENVFPENMDIDIQRSTGEIM